MAIRRPWDLIAGWFTGHRKLNWFSLIEILNNPGGKVDTCGTSLLRRPQVDSAPVITAPWVWHADSHLPCSLMRLSDYISYFPLSTWLVTGLEGLAHGVSSENHVDRCLVTCSFQRDGKKDYFLSVSPLVWREEDPFELLGSSFFEGCFIIPRFPSLLGAFSAACNLWNNICQLSSTSGYLVLCPWCDYLTFRIIFCLLHLVDGNLEAEIISKLLNYRHF